MQHQNLKKNKLKIFVSLLFLLLISGFYQCKSSLEDELVKNGADSTAITAADEELSAKSTGKNATLKSAFSFPFGAAVVIDRLEDKPYIDILKKDFRSVTPESSMKFGALHPSKDTYTWTKADGIVAFAQANGMRVHGHTLIWGKDGRTPDWVVNYKGNKDDFLKLLKDHIQTVVKHFKGKVNSWDVVNEAFQNNGKYKSNIWYKKLGEEYLYKSFQYAQEADPNALLFYNDYGQEFGGAKLQAIIDMAANCKKRGIAIHGFGLQMHTNLNLSIGRFSENLVKLKNTGLLIHLSELDIAVRDGQPEHFALSAKLNTALAAKYKAIVKTYLSLPAKQQFGITTWGVSDRNSFYNDNYPNIDHDYPLLFDKNYAAKPAYTAVIEAGKGL